MYGVYMTSTTATATVKCVYCSGSGSVWGGVYAPARRCLICKGTGRMAPIPCDTCNAPLLDGEPRRWDAGTVSHSGC